MSALRFFVASVFSPRAMAILMAMAMIAAGVGLPPVAFAGATVDGDDRQSSSQPCEESPEESAEDEESSAGKHTAILGISLSFAPPTVVGVGAFVLSHRIHASLLASAMPIRGPPSAA